MYESFFGFDQRPFLTVPTLDRYFPTASMEQAYQTVTRAIARCEGPVAIFGGAGLGKTMCCMRIADSVSKSFEVVTLASSHIITRRALLQSLLYELGMPYRDPSEGELRLNLLERLQPSEEHHSEGLVLIVDEAQTLSTKLLDELRLLTNIVRQGVPRVRLVLCGTMKLEDSLAHPHLESLNQRLAARCYLTPMSNAETGRYVQHKVELCGVRWEEAMTRDALEAIYRASDGIPRLVDQVADQGLLLGAQEKIRPVNAAVIGYAWSILQQLPNPWSDPAPISQTPVPGAFNEDFFEEEHEPMATLPSALMQARGASTIEFGQLDEPFESYAPTVEDETSDNFAISDRAASDARAAVPPHESFFRVFEEGFDEEFSIPVQSIDNYQSLSGIALGDLNYDAETMHTGTMQGDANIDARDAYPEAEDFLDLRTHVSPIDEKTWPEQLQPNAPGTDSAPAILSEIELQIQEEVRDMVANMNLSAMTLEPNQSDCTAYASSNEGESSEDGSPLLDDRDMILIEDDVDELRDATAQAIEAQSRARIHPYAQLFSKMRQS